MQMAKVVLPDTNVVLRYLLRDHEAQYTRACELFESVRVGHRHMVILEGVVVECVHVLTKYYRVPRPAVAEHLRGLLMYKGVRNPDREDLVDALGQYGETKLDIVDCILLAKGKGGDLEVFSFDGGLCSRLGGSRA